VGWAGLRENGPVKRKMPSVMQLVDVSSCSLVRKEAQGAHTCNIYAAAAYIRR
jgi:hypothetical protein